MIHLNLVPGTHICIFTEYYIMVELLIFAKYLSSGGAEVVLREICDNLPEDIDAKLVIAFNHNNPPELLEKYNPLQLNITFRRGLIGGILNYIVSFFKYLRVLYKYKPKASLGFGDFECLCNQFSCLISGTKMIQSYRNNVRFPNASPLGKLLNPLQVYVGGKLADKIIVNSLDNKTLLVEKYHVREDKIEVIYNPKDIQKIVSLSSEPVTEEIFQTTEPIIVTVGRCVPEKGQYHLIRIFSDIRKTMRCKLVICGDGVLRGNLESLISAYHLDDDVYITGWCDNPYKYLSQATVFAFPSIFEGLPNALIEAMICGCPVVSADCDFGPREILDGGKYGYLSKKLGGVFYSADVPLTDAEIDMRDKLLEVLVDSGVQNELSNCSKSRMNIFDRKKLLGEYYDVFRDILSRG